MPPKTIKTSQGRVTIKSIRLANGNLLVPERVRVPNGIDEAVWVEVPPDDPRFKRWWPVSVDEGDPR